MCIDRPLNTWNGQLRRVFSHIQALRSSRHLHCIGTELGRHNSDSLCERVKLQVISASYLLPMPRQLVDP
jgi:hypothetical protein